MANAASVKIPIKYQNLPYPHQSPKNTYELLVLKFIPNNFEVLSANIFGLLHGRRNTICQTRVHSLLGGPADKRFSFKCKSEG